MNESRAKLNPLKEESNKNVLETELSHLRQSTDENERPNIDENQENTSDTKTEKGVVNYHLHPDQFQTRNGFNLIGQDSSSRNSISKLEQVSSLSSFRNKSKNALEILLE